MGIWWYPLEVPLVLASSSPRRRAILEMAGIPFVQRPVNVNEEFDDGTPGETVRHLADRKARSVLSAARGCPVLGADTMVSTGGELLGKPSDGPEAFEMLSRLSGAWHSVFGGVSVIWPERNISILFFEETRVLFRNLEDAEIRAYVETGEPMDKAGAYGIQGYGSMLVDRIDGCYFNVMGLPLPRFVHEFREALRQSEAERGR